MNCATRLRGPTRTRGRSVMTTTLTGGSLLKRISSKNRSHVAAALVLSAMSLVTDTDWSSLIVLSTVISSASVICGRFLTLFTMMSLISSRFLARIFNKRSNLPCISCISSTSSCCQRIFVITSVNPCLIFIPMNARWLYPSRRLSAAIVNLRMIPDESSLFTRT